MKKTICPFCFRKIKKAHIRDDNIIVPEKDEKFSKYFGRNEVGLGQVYTQKDFLNLNIEIKLRDIGKIIPNFNIFTKLNLDRKILYIVKLILSLNRSVKLKEKQYYICPECHLPLPTGSTKDMIGSKLIAVIGGRNAGKSNYFGVLRKELKDKVGDEVGFTVIARDTFDHKERKLVSSNNIYKERFGNELYKNHRAIGQTNPFSQDPQIRIPLIYRLKFNKGSFLDSKVIDLIFFDSAGEDIQDKETIDKFYNYIFCASGILYLIDPLDFPGVIGHPNMDENVLSKLNPDDKEPGEIFEDIVDLFGHFDDRNPIPIAFVLTKSDMLRDLDMLGHSSHIFANEPKHDHGFDEEDMKIVSKEVKNLVDRWQGKHLLNVADNYFKEKEYFAVSALGQMPDNNQNLSKPITPHRLSDPILWLFWKNKLIPSLSEWTLSHTLYRLNEVVTTIVLFYIFITLIPNFSNNSWSDALSLSFLLSFIFGGFSTAIHPEPKAKFYIKQAIYCLFFITFILLFLPVKYLPLINLFLLAMCVSSICQRILSYLHSEKMLFLNKLSKKIGLTVFFGFNWIISVFLSCLIIYFYQTILLN